MMVLITKPSQVDHPVLQNFAQRATWVAKLEEAVEALEALVFPPVDDADESDELDILLGDEPADEDALKVAHSVVYAAYEEADGELEADLIAWLGKDPEHWSIFRLIVLDPWQEALGQWRDGVPRWIQTLGTNTSIAHFQHDPYGRRRQVDL